MNIRTTAFLASFAAALVALPADAAPIRGGVEFEASGNRLTVEALTDSIVRVRISDAGAPLPPDESWSVLPGIRAHRAVVRQSSNGFSTSALSVAVDPAGLRLTIRRPDGKIIVDDAPSNIERQGAGFSIRKAGTNGARILALGDKTGGLDRAGKSFVNWNTDAYGFGTATDPIYKSIPFYISMDGDQGYGLLLDNSFRSWFDFGHRNEGIIEMAADGGPIDYYIMAGPSLPDITRAQTQLTGRAPLPPRWTLGFQQSRYSYMSSAEVRDLVARFKAEHFPLDAVWLDIDFQDRNRPFTVNRTAFPDFEKMIADLDEQGIKTITIVDLHIARAANQNYGPYDSGVAGDHFLKSSNGSLYVGDVWPGPSVFPDFTREETRLWWGPLFKPLLDAGVAGIWNDMNEPAIFESPNKTMRLDTQHRISGDSRAPRTATHAEIHNVLGMENSRATYEGLLKLRPNQRPFVLTRASFAGGQRYAATWTGDNSSTYEHLKLAVAQVINLGLSGFTWSGPDVGGFIGGSSPDLLTLWHGYGSFMPLMRNHSGRGAPRAEPWVDGPDHLAVRRAYVDERYRLMPYYYAVAANSARTGDPFLRPIDYDYSLKGVSCDPSMSFTIGAKLLVAGNPHPESPQPYSACLPSGGWYDYRTGKPVEQSDATKLIPSVDHIPVFVRAGSIIPKQALVMNNSQVPNGPLELHVYPGANCAGELYDDDGLTISGPTRQQSVRCTTNGRGSTQVTFERPNGTYRPWWTKVEIIIHGPRGESRQLIDRPDRRRTVEILTP